MNIGIKYKDLYHKARKSFGDLTIFEKTVTVIGSIEPIASVPQVYLVYSLQSADQLSLFSWGFSVFAEIMWLVYGISRKSWPLVISSSLWLAVDVPIVIAIFIFG